MGHATLTGQVSPPPRPYSLSADARAWWAALRGLRDNPLLTHLLMAERRRRKRRPAWRSWVAVVGITIAAVLWFAYERQGFWNFPRVWVYAVIGAVYIAYGVWLLQCVFQAVLGALGVLGRWVRRPSHLVLDDFTCLSNLTDHEIAAAAIAWLWPPLARCGAWGGAVVVAISSIRSYIDEQGYGAQYVYLGAQTATDDWYSFLECVLASLQNVPLVAVSCVLSAAAALSLVLWFICLGRSLNVELTGPVAARMIALTQVAYPIYYEWSSGMDFTEKILTSESMFYYGVLLVAAPLYSGLLLSLARRLPWLRAVLTLVSPFVIGVLLSVTPFMMLCLGEAVSGDIGTNYLSVVPHAIALAASACVALSPQWMLLHAVVHGWNAYDMCGAYGGFSLSLLVPLQLATLYILSRFVIEAVGARRRRGE